MNKNIHLGHRDRLRDRLDGAGLEAFSDVETLELLLTYAIPRCSTNEAAHRLLDRFGGFRGVMEADPAELSCVRGVGESAARLINLVSQINRRYSMSARCSRPNILNNTVAAVAYLRPLFEYTREELAFAVTMNTEGTVIHCHRLAKGLTNKVEFSARMIVRAALQDNAAYLVLAHNHVSDNALPSQTDVNTTQCLEKLLSNLGVGLRDHFIISGGEFVSMRESGLM